MRKFLLNVAVLAVTVVALQTLQGLSVRADQDEAPSGPVATENGDTNGDGNRDIADAVHLLSWLYQGGQQPVAFACNDNEVAQLQYTLLRDSLDNEDDDTGRWQHASGRIMRGRLQLGTFIEVKRVTSPGSTAFNVATTTLTLFFNKSRLDSSEAPESMTLQGAHSFNSGEKSGSVSASSKRFCEYIGKTFVYGNNVLTIGN